MASHAPIRRSLAALGLACAAVLILSGLAAPCGAQLCAEPTARPMPMDCCPTPCDQPVDQPSECPHCMTADSAPVPAVAALPPAGPCADAELALAPTDAPGVTVPCRSDVGTIRVHAPPAVRLLPERALASVVRLT